MHRVMAQRVLCCSGTSAAKRVATLPTSQWTVPRRTLIVNEGIHQINVPAIRCRRVVLLVSESEFK